MSTGPIDVRPIVVAVGDGPADEAVQHVAALREAAPSAAIVAVVDDASAGLDLRLLEAGADEIADGVAADAVPERLVARAVIRRRERVTLAGRLAARAAVDELTGLATRRPLLEAIGAEQARAHRVPLMASRPAALLVDLDGLKVINDVLGHAAGDAVLTEAARRMRARLRVSDLAARIGGDEFAILLRTGADPAVVAADVVAALRFGHGAREVSASVGVVSLADAATPRQCLELADTAMYHAKRAGGNRYAIHPASLLQAHVR